VTRNGVAGSLFGLAYGDALGAPTEFMSVGAILQRCPPNGPRDLPPGRGGVARVTDDTQMALAVGEALLDAGPPFTAQRVEGPLRRAFVEWLRSPDNDRAPGNTCLQACHALETGVPWVRATVKSSKGCGANMRVTPVGLLPREQADERTRAGVAQLQAALTHGHPTGLAAADLTARAVAELLEGCPPPALPRRLRAYALAQRDTYHAEWLGELWQQPGVISPQGFIARGWDECLGVLDLLEAALAQQDRESDPCLSTGAGWVAEEAFATGLLCFLLSPDRPVEALRRAATTSGDSDSIAALCGAFAGAALGMDAWPAAWAERIEYRARLSRLAAAWERE
jgi:ADP-ribosylglycohydrolase